MTPASKRERNIHTAPADGSLDLFVERPSVKGFYYVAFRLPGANTGTPGGRGGGFGGPGGAPPGGGRGPGGPRGVWSPGGARGRAPATPPRPAPKQQLPTTHKTN